MGVNRAALRHRLQTCHPALQKKIAGGEENLEGLPGTVVFLLQGTTAKQVPD